MTPKLQNDRVLVRPDKSKKTTSSGFILSWDEADAPQRGTVVAIGPGAKSKKDVVIPMTVAVGDTILYPKGIGSIVKLDNEELQIIKEEEILAIQEE